jgi:anti-sigma factor ChrR (cupin superfamily)
MRIRADFSRRAVVRPDEHQWVASPQSGVARVMLDRVGAEKARATSLVRYAPESRFSPHEHPGGEEILVLSGVFSETDATPRQSRAAPAGGENSESPHSESNAEPERHAPAGWYLRNPPGSSHRPSSREGALIFVKLWQMPPGQREHVRIDTRDPACWVRQDDRECCPLFSSDHERVELCRLGPMGRLPVESEGGTELLVLAGDLTVDDQPCPEGSWIRLPPGDSASIVAGPRGLTVYRKTGHLSPERLESLCRPDAES